MQVRPVTPNIWCQPGILVIYGAMLEAEAHKHNAIQLIWPSKNTETDLAEQSIAGAVVIASNVTHRLSMQNGWVILVEPQSRLGIVLGNYLQNDPFREINELPPFLPSLSTTFTWDSGDRVTLPVEPLSPLLNVLGLELPEVQAFFNTKGQTIDPRIEMLLEKLNACFGSECLKPDKWRAEEVAAELALSEGRFLHLFRQEMGLAWRPYLLWRRLLCAISVMIAGKTATDAAYLAGFSDSAHLSRTFRSQFGLSIRSALATFSKAP